MPLIDQKRQPATSTDDDILSMISTGHNVLMQVLSSRNSSLQFVRAMWSAGNVKVCVICTELVGSVAQW